MTWLTIALILVGLTFLVFAWALCAIGAQTDRRDETIRKREGR